MSVMFVRWLVLVSLSIASVAAIEERAGAANVKSLTNSDSNELKEEEKRGQWQNLHGVWGKRAWQDLNSAWGKRAWQDLNSAWGKRAWQDLNSAWGKRAWQDLNSAWGKRAWQDLNSAWGKRAWQDLNSAWGKRAWQDLNSPWGKRAWQDLNSAWGKRAWQDLNSAWGKRVPESSKWQSLQGVWGKRSSPTDDEFPEQLESIKEQPNYEDLMQALEQAEYEGVDSPLEKKASWIYLHGKRPLRGNSKGPYWKREPGWTKLRGMWGKRSNPLAQDMPERQLEWEGQQQQSAET